MEITSKYFNWLHRNHCYGFKVAVTRQVSSQLYKCFYSWSCLVLQQMKVAALNSESTLPFHFCPWNNLDLNAACNGPLCHWILEHDNSAQPIMRLTTSSKTCSVQKLLDNPANQRGEGMWGKWAWIGGVCQLLIFGSLWNKQVRQISTMSVLGNWAEKAKYMGFFSFQP